MESGRTGRPSSLRLAYATWILLPRYCRTVGRTSTRIRELILSPLAGTVKIKGFQLRYLRPFIVHRLVVDRGTVAYRNRRSVSCFLLAGGGGSLAVLFACVS